MGFRVFGLAGFKKMRCGLAGERMHVGLSYSRTLLPRRFFLCRRRGMDSGLGFRASGVGVGLGIHGIRSEQCHEDIRRRQRAQSLLRLTGVWDLYGIGFRGLGCRGLEFRGVGFRV